MTEVLAMRRARRSARWFIGLLATTTIALGLALSPARAADAPDWVELEIVVGPQGANVELLLSMRAVGDTSGPLLWGVGFSEGPYGYVAVFDEGGGPTSVGVPGAQAVNVRLLSGASFHLFLWDELDDLAPGTQIRILAFVANAEDPEIYKSARVNAGSATLTWREGTGAVGLPASVVAGKRGAVVGSAAVGDLGQQVDVPAGIAGGMSGHCISCEMSWEAPDGRVGVDSSIGVPQVLSVASATAPFAGPPGTWTWSWSGVRAAQPSFAGSPGLVGWAPVGDSWVHYATPFPPGYQLPTAPVDPPAPLDVVSAAGPGWVAYTVDAVEGAELSLEAVPLARGARAVAAGVSMAGGWSAQSYEWDGGAHDTRVELAGQAIVAEHEARVDPRVRPYVATRGLRAGRYSLVAYVAGLGDVDRTFTLRGVGVTVAGRTEGTSAFVIGDHAFAPAAQVDVRRPVPRVPFGPSGVGGSATAAGVAERSIEGRFFGWFTSAGDVTQLATEMPDGAIRPEGDSFSGAPPGRYRFHVVGDVSTSAESVVVIGADYIPPAA